MSPAPVTRQTWRWMFGSMILDIREAAGCSVEEAANLSGMELSEWATIEAGYIPADLTRLRSMAATLEIRYDQLANLVFLCQWALQD